MTKGCRRRGQAVSSQELSEVAEMSKFRRIDHAAPLRYNLNSSYDVI
jgi:hypothetical protein